MKKIMALFGLLMMSIASQASMIYTTDFEELEVNNLIHSVPTQNNGNYFAWYGNGDSVLSLTTDTWVYVSFADLFGFDTLDLDTGDTYTLNLEMRFNPGAPEIGGFMLANDAFLNNIGLSQSQYAFNIGGTQDYGFDDFQYDFNAIDTWQSFSIRLDKFISGQFQYLVFINDCDSQNCETNVRFSSMTMQVPEPQFLSVFALALLGLRRFRRAA